MTDQPETLRVAQAPVSEPVPEAELMARLLERGGFTVAAGMMREQHAALEKKSDAIQRLWKERDQLRAVVELLLAAVLAEREACAKVCDEVIRDLYIVDGDASEEVLRCAKAIRSRGEVKS